MDWKKDWELSQFVYSKTCLGAPKLLGRLWPAWSYHRWYPLLCSCSFPHWTLSSLIYVPGTSTPTPTPAPQLASTGSLHG